MHAIKAALEKKRKLLSELAPADSSSKFVKKSDLEKLPVQQPPSLSKSSFPSSFKSESSNLTLTSTTSTTATTTHEDEDIDLLKISPEEVIKRLRARLEPIRLFAESDSHRLRRLKLLESKDESSDGQQNDFRKALEKSAEQANLDYLKKKSGVVEDFDSIKKKQKELEDNSVDTSIISFELFEKDPDLNIKLVRIYFKRLIKEWEKDLNERSDEEKRTAEWKNAAAIQQQSIHYMKPFFRQLKSRSVPPDVMARISEICGYLQEREYLKANDTYLRLAIGNAPWPIGVTMVGIHERSAREKIHASQVAHVLNDEEQRKWIQSIKRLMTFCQKLYPPDDLSKLVG
ncbi:mRNA splicing protein prp18 [Nowakowskiella sp. JEL0407]|nr:mRNA splicing protein prp18 [Nowakowskiella sp. JEL0407]